MVLASARLLTSGRGGQSWAIQRELGNAMIAAADERGGTYADGLRYLEREKVYLADRNTSAPTYTRPTGPRSFQWTPDVRRRTRSPI
ncbi:MAG: hypothetical protein ACI9OJ_004983 [Myxococcota bacterium]|jgi:hypothetical protein